MGRDVGVIVVAGGAGIRAGGGVPKQYRELAGVPMVVRTVSVFLRHSRVHRVVLVLPAADVAAPPSWLDALRTTAGDRLTVTAGGRERSDSVARGLDALDARCTVVLVHDAARPFVSDATIDAVIAAADAGDAAIAAVAVGDTLKAADPADPTRAIRTVAREHLWRAQTPQGFPAELLREAHRRLAADPAPVTDDATLVERLGASVRLVPDSTRNFKITTADDLALAQLIASAEAAG